MAISTMDNGTASDVFVFTYEQRRVVASFFSVIALLSILGNSLVIFAVTISEKLWTTTNVFVLNLAFADLITGLTLPFNVMALLSVGTYPVSSVLCTLAAWTMFTCVGCSLYTLAIIAFNRLVMITKPMWYGRIFKDRIVFACVLLLWGLPLLQTAIPTILGAGQIGYNIKYGVCAQLDVSNAYDFAQAIGLYPISLVVILACYTRIYVYLRDHNEGVMKRDSENKSQTASQADVYTGPRKIQISESNHSFEATADDIPNGSTRSNIQTNISKRQVEITKNLFYVVSAFVICVTPYAICLLVEESDPAMPYTASLMLFNSCINPVIYATKHPYFKEVFRCIVRCRWREVPKPSRFLKWMLDLGVFGVCKKGSRISI